MVVGRLSSVVGREMAQSVKVPFVPRYIRLSVVCRRLSVIGREMAQSVKVPFVPRYIRSSVVGCWLLVVGYRSSVVDSRVVISFVSMAAMRLVSATSFDALSADIAPMLTAM